VVANTKDHLLSRGTAKQPSVNTVSVVVAEEKSSHPKLAHQTNTLKLAPSPPIKYTQYAIADTGCTGHYITIDAPHRNKRIASPSIAVVLPDGSILNSSHTTSLIIPGLPEKACEAHIFPTMQKSLISNGQLCDHGCVAIFTRNINDIIKESNTPIVGMRPNAPSEPSKTTSSPRCVASIGISH
jgi:hypothetical protein